MRIKAVWIGIYGVLAFCTQAFSSPYPETSYFSLYQQPKTYTYTDLNGVSQTQSRVGYRYQNDRTDSIVVCGKENDSDCIAASFNTVYTLRASYPGKITAFKVYVPPGTISVNLLSHVGQPGQFFTIARLGTPPQLDSEYVPAESEYNGLPDDGFTLSELRNADCVGRNSSGYLFIAKDSGLAVALESDGGWLYVIVKSLLGGIVDNAYTNQVKIGTPGTSGTYLGWYTEKTQNNTWDSLGEPSYIGAASTPTPIPMPTGCDPFSCANAGGRCVDSVCVIPSPKPTPIPTPTQVPTPTPTPASISLAAKLMSEQVVEMLPCANLDLNSLEPVLTINPPPDGNVTFYSALLFPGATPNLYFAQKDILQNDAFILYTSGDPIKEQMTGAYPSNGLWKDEAFKSVISQLSGGSCATIAASGISFLFGFAPEGDISKYQGAVFSFTAPTPAPTPTPTPAPTPLAASITFAARPLSELVAEKVPCANIDIVSLVPALLTNSPPGGNFTFYSALFFPDVTPYLFFAQKDVLQNDAFILYASGDPIKGHATGAYPSDGTWADQAFHPFLSQLSGITCAAMADAGIYFLFGFAPDGDFSQFQGALFTFTTMP